jgi:hypothetical protein
MGLKLPPVSSKMSGAKTVVMERDTLRRIREAIEKGTLVQPSRPADVNRAWIFAFLWPVN